MSTHGIPRNTPGVARCVAIKRGLFYDVAAAYKHGAASLEDLEQASDELQQAKEAQRKAASER